MKTTKKISILFLFATAMAALAFSGCQTADGLGRDVENLGESMQQ
jgi:predicted small secreted protein